MIPLKPNVFLLTVALVLSLAFTGSTALAQATAPPEPGDFVSVFKQYAETINSEGGNGLRRLSTANFVVVNPVSHERMIGAEAFEEAARWFEPSQRQRQGNGYGFNQYTVRFSVVQLKERTALIYTEDVRNVLRDSGSFAYPLPYQQQPPQVFVPCIIANYSSTRWRQEWVKTSRGWKLAVVELDTRTEAERDAQDTFCFVVKSILPAKKVAAK